MCCRFCSTDIHISINLHRVGPDNLPLKVQCQIDGDSGFADAGRAADDDDFRFGVGSIHNLSYICSLPEMTLAAHEGPFLLLAVAAFAAGVKGFHQTGFSADVLHLMTIRATLVLG